MGIETIFIRRVEQHWIAVSENHGRYAYFRWAVRWAPYPSRTQWIWKRWVVGTVWCAVDERYYRRRWHTRHFRDRRYFRHRCHFRDRHHRRYRFRRPNRRHRRRRHRRPAVTRTAGSWSSRCSRTWAGSPRSGPSVSASPICRFGCARLDRWDWCRWPSWRGTGTATGSGRASPAGRPGHSASGASEKIPTRTHIAVQ